MRVEVAYAEADAQTVVAVELAEGATVADALAAVAERPPFAQLNLSGVALGVFGDRVERDRLLVDGDRVEIYRPLIIDPREARQRRAAAQSPPRSPRSGRSRR